MGKAEKRARKKQGRRDRIEAQTKAAEKQRKKRLNIVLAVILVGAVAVIAFTQLTKKTKKVTTSASPAVTATATSTASPAPSVAGAVPTATASVSATAASCPATAPPAQGPHATQAAAPPMTISASTSYTATFTTTCGTFAMSLDAKDSPNTVNSIVYLAKKGFFDGLKFHRISKSANVIQGGDPNGDGSGGPGYNVVDPPPASVASGAYPAGTVAMAKTGQDPSGTSGSQFFIVPPGATSSIGPNYAVLGTISSGQDTLSKIYSDVPPTSGYDGPPQVPVYIIKVTVTP